MSAKPDYVVNTLTRPTGAAATGGYVINLTSSTTPMALSQPKDPTLAQYTFFVSRRLEDGRERFRLHMGYFESQQAAEEMLAVVREVYPSAWAGEAPGKKLRAGATAAPAAPARAAAAPAQPKAPATPPAPVAAAAPAAKPAAVPAAAAPPAPPAEERHPFASTPAPAPKPEFEEPFVLSEADAEFKPMDVPVVHPPVAQPVVSPPPQAAAKPAPKPAAKPAAKAPAKPAATAPAKAPAKAAAPARPAAAAKPAAPAAAKPAAAKPAAAARPAAPATPVAPATPAAPAKPAAARPAPAKPPVAAPKIAAQVTAPAFTAAKPAVAPAPMAPKAPPAEPTVQMPAISPTTSLNSVRQAIDELDDLSDTQTIRLLERHSPYREGSREADVDEAIRVIKPEDTQSMMAIKSDVKRNAPVLFAVQLDWSVTPFDMAKIPPLAIFNAYTLYTTEAARDGRTWYGLRLGFFSDAVSAKQVAYYVRSDFKTVSVVPVTTIEKERATDLNAARSGIYKAANIKEVPAPTPQSMSSSTSGVFKLLDDDTPAHIEQDVDGEMSPRFSKPAPEKPAPKAPAAAAPSPVGKSRKPPPKGVKRDAHAQVDEETLDQTLEILGAHSLEITNDSAGDTGVRHLRVKIDKKGSKFASLIDRLSGKK